MKLSAFMPNRLSELTHPQAQSVHRNSNIGWAFEALGTLVLALAVVSALFGTGVGHAQPAAVAPQANLPASAASGAMAKVVVRGTAWRELTPMQQRALAPLAATWNTGVNESQKRKWLEVSKNFHTLSPEDQATLNSRMNDWVALSPQQRAQARLNFGKTKELSRELTPTEKKAHWETYQALSSEEKQKLAAKASPKPAGAATAVKPVAPQKLANVPLPATSRAVPSSAPKSTLPSVPPTAGTASTAPPPLRAASGLIQQ